MRNSTARELRNMVASCDTNFNEELISAQNMMKMNEKAYYSSICEEAIAQYDKLMKNKASTIENLDQLWQIHKENKNMAFEQLEKASFVGTSSCKAIYKQHYEDTCNKHFENTEQQFLNQIKMQKLQREERTNEAFNVYRDKMEKELSGVQTDKEIDAAHKKHYDEVLNVKSYPIDSVTLESKVNKFLKKFVTENQKRRKLYEEHQESERQIILLKLAKKLEDEASNTWQKHLQTGYLDDEIMQKKNSEIQLYTSQEFWKQAPLSEETKRAIEKELNKKEQMKEKDKSSYETDEGTWKYWIKANVLAKAAIKTSAVFKKDVSNFLKWCEPHAGAMHQELQAALKTLNQNAQEQNDGNWKHLQEKIRSTVEDLVLKITQSYNEKMRDRHINENEIKKQFDEFSRVLLKNASSTCNKDFGGSKKAEEFYREQVEQQPKIARDEILARNAKNKEYANSRDSEVVPMWQSILQSIGEFVSKIGPTLIQILTVLATKK